MMITKSSTRLLPASLELLDKAELHKTKSSQASNTDEDVGSSDGAVDENVAQHVAVASPDRIFAQVIG